MCPMIIDYHMLHECRLPATITLNDPRTLVIMVKQSWATQIIYSFVDIQV